MDEARDSLGRFVEERHSEFASRELAVEGDTITALAGGYRKLWKPEAYWERFCDGLRKAGLPD